MPNNVPVNMGSVGKTAPTAKSGGIETGPPEGKRTPKDSTIDADTITAKDDVGTYKNSGSNGGTTPMAGY